MRAWIALAVVAWLAGPAAGQPAATTNPEIEKLEHTLQKHEAARDLRAQVQTLRKLVDAQKKLSGTDSIYVWRRELSLLSMLQLLGEYTEAIELQKSMLASAERKKDAGAIRDRLTGLAGNYQMARRLEEADQTYVRLLEVSKKLHGPNGRLYASDLGGYASLRASRGEYVAAQRLHEQALKIEEALKEDVKGRLTTLGMLYMLTDVTRAKATFDRYLALIKSDPVVQRTQMTWWVSGFYRRAGRLDLAAPLEKQVTDATRAEIARIEKAKGKDAAELGTPLFSLGTMLMEVGDLAAADPVLTRAVELAEKIKAPFVPYAQLATLRRKQGRRKDALALYEKAQATMPGGTGLYPMMADIHRELGDTAKAKELYLAAQKDLDRLYGKGAALVARLHLGLYAVYLAAKQIADAERVLAQNLDVGERELSLVLASGTEADHLAYITREARLLDTAIHFHAALARKRGTAARLALTTLLRRKGRILDAAAASLGTIRQRLPAADRKLLDELEQTRAKLAKVAVQGAQANPDFGKQVAAFEDQIQKLEVALARKNAELEVVLSPVTLADVQKGIPKGALLVEMVNYQPGDPTAPYSATPKLPPRRYAAYVLGRRGDPTLVDLGEAAVIDDAIGKLRAALADSDRDDAAEIASTVHDLTFAKLRKALGSVTNVIIAPDGALNVVPFAALHDGKQYLVTRFTFTYVTSGRDLLRFRTRAKGKRGAPVIFADPDFDGTKQAAPPPTRRSRAMQGLKFGRLPGTAEEADALVKSLTSAIVYRGKDATESTLKSVRAPSILHLATHGFFLSDADATVENPLLRSGLVFAGANALSSGSDDGVVTALEAAGLDLRGTKLVVMSACQTGVGKITNGEGVYGLRRAFVIAGAESLVMSLWEVDDAATRDLMAGYYKKLTTGMGRSDALRDIQREMHASKKYAHPYYWASFVAAGDNAPL